MCAPLDSRNIRNSATNTCEIRWRHHSRAPAREAAEKPESRPLDTYAVTWEPRATLATRGKFARRPQPCQGRVRRLPLVRASPRDAASNRKRLSVISAACPDVARLCVQHEDLVTRIVAGNGLVPASGVGFRSWLLAAEEANEAYQKQSPHQFTAFRSHDRLVPMGTEFDRAVLVEAICERLAGGEALAAVCRDDAMPTTRTFLRWADEDEAVALEYSRALQARAEWFASEHDRIRKTAVDRESAAAARVQLNGLEFMMSKMAPKRYGDRLDVAVDASFDLGAMIDRGRQRILEARQAGDRALPAPEGEAEQ